MTLEEEIRGALLSAGDGFVGWNDAAEWLVQYPKPRDFSGSSVNTAFLIGSGYLGEALTKKYGPPPIVETEGGTTNGTRIDNADWRVIAPSRCEVSIEILRAATVATGNIALLKLIQEALEERRQILEKEQGDIFLPLDHAAEMLAQEHWTATDENKKLARLVWKQKCPEQAMPHENGKPCDTDEAYLWWARYWDAMEWQQAIDRLAANGLISLHSPLDLSPTHDKRGAFISKNELVSLKYAGAHLKTQTQQPHQAVAGAHEVTHGAKAFQPLDFISLAEVLNSIADYVDAPPHIDDSHHFKDPSFNSTVKRFYKASNTQIEWARKLGFAARFLIEAMSGRAEHKPIWRKSGSDKRRIVDIGLDAEEGFSALERAAVRGSNLQSKCADHVRQASVGNRADLIDIEFVGRPGVIAPAEEILSESHLGFYFDQIAAFLDANGIKHGLMTPPNGAAATGINAGAPVKSGPTSHLNDRIQPKKSEDDIEPPNVRVAWLIGLYKLLPAIIEDKGSREVMTVIRELRRRGSGYSILTNEQHAAHGGQDSEIKWKDGGGNVRTVSKKTVSSRIVEALKWLKDNGHIPA